MQTFQRILNPIRRSMDSEISDLWTMRKKCKKIGARRT
jgi:hypothetical protein